MGLLWPDLDDGWVGYWCGCSVGDFCILAHRWHGLGEDSEWSPGRRRIVYSFHGEQIAGPEALFSSGDVRGGVDLYIEFPCLPFAPHRLEPWWSSSGRCGLSSLRGDCRAAGAYTLQPNNTMLVTLYVVLFKDECS